jgi:tetratricopeptide (TPR) repeat protein
MRSRALISNSLGDSELDTLHLRKAIALLDSSARDWEAIVRIDPTNQIAWNNLGNARLTTAWALSRAGRISESQRQWVAALAVEKQAAPSPMISSMLSIPAAALAGLEADRGNREAAEVALADHKRLTKLAIREFPPDSFPRSAIGEFGVFGQGIYANYALPIAAADYSTVQTMAQASIQRAESFKPGNPQQELIKHRGLGATYAVLADAFYNLKDYAAADKAIKRAIGHRQLVPTRTLQDKRDASDELILAAMIAARLGRPTEAQQIIDPMLKFHRGLYTRDNEDVGQHLQLAKALYASALVSPGKAAQLAEAAAIIDGVPPEMRHLKSTSLVRNYIAEEQKVRSK